MFYRGCYVDEDDNRRFPTEIPFTKVMPKTCAVKCKRNNFKYCAVQAGSKCFCGNDLDKNDLRPESECNLPCTYLDTERCGGTLRNDVYDTGAGGHQKGGEGLCGCYGDPHCKTFDGEWIHFQNTCRYTMVRDNCGGTVPGATPTFNVVAQFWDRDLDVAVTWVKEVYVTIDDIEYGIHQEKVVTKNGITISLPYDDGNGIIIDRDGAFVMFHYITVDLKVYYDGKQTFEAILDDTYNGITCGFCGNKNSDPEDDMLQGPACKADGNPFYGPATTNVNLFGISWTDLAYASEHDGCIDCDIQPPPGLCEGQALADANEACNNMYYENNAPLEQCWNELSELQKSGFIYGCLFDYCNVGEDSICDLFVYFADFCLSEYNILLEDWGTFEQCDDICDGQNEVRKKCSYQRDSTCYEFLKNPLPRLDDKCVRGCFCKEDFVRNSRGVCVSTEECGCVYDTATLETNDYYIDYENCKLVQCKTGNQTEVIEDLDCDDNAVCIQNNIDDINCVCNEGYAGDGEHCYQCEDPENRDNMSYTSEGNEVGDKTVYGCDDGFKDNGENPEIECLPSGNWSYSYFECTKIECEDPEDIDNTSYSSEGNQVGNKTVYKCDVGFEDNGENPEIECLSSGNWSHSYFACTKVDCGSPPDECTAEGTEYGDNATCECDDGHTTSGNTTIFCQANGNWSEPEHNCTRVNCGDVPEQCTANNTEYLDEAECECPEGYITTGNTTRVCQADGDWSDKNYNCTEIECEDPEDIDNTSYSSEGNQVGNKTVYECDVGFEDNGENPEIECLSSGNWSHSYFACTKVDCGSPPDECTAEGTEYGDNATCECDDGHTTSGNTTIFCQANGNWSEPEHNCTRVNCGDVPEQCTANNTEYLVEAECECPEGYITTGNTTRVCQADGDWADKNYNCTEIECEDPEDIDNTSYSSEGNQVGNKTVYECDVGFEDNGENPEIECLSSGNWSHSYFACTKVDCGSPPDECTAEGTEYGDNATCECDDGHTTSGNTTIFCQANGNWSEPEHNCTRVNCGDVPEQCTANNTEYPNEADCECPEGYITTGNTTRVCQADGDWSDKNYNCTEIECEDPEDIDNTSYSSEGNQVGNKTVYECDVGFEDNGENPEIECLSSGNWSHSYFACTKVDCGSPPDECTAGGTEYGDNATCECDDGHTTSGNTTIFCHANGNWSEPEHNCTRVNCGDVPEQCTANNTEYLDEAECECPEGYITTGNTTRVCQADGDWSDKNYNCTEIECEDPEDIDNTSYSSEGNQVGNKTVYECDVGFEDNGENPEIECLSSGNWSHSYFACTKVDCGSPPDECTAGGTEYGDNATCECDDGHTTSGNTTIFCQADGNWSEPEHNCTKVDCGSPPYECTGGGTEYGDKATCECDDGHTTSGNTTIVCQANGNWSEPEHNCTKVDCGSPPDECTAEGTEYSDKATCGCDGDFTAIGNTTIVCQDDGTWSDREFNCSSVCIDSEGDPWIQLDSDISSSYYFFQGNDRTFDKAKEQCEDRGGMLVRIDSYEENQMLWDYIRNKGGNRWTALRVNHDTGIEYWTHSPGVQANFTNWADGEPNDHTGEESCVQLLKENGKWNDVECVKTIQVICEMIECGGWWSEWVLWSECDVTCGDGVEVYHRQCYGDICPGGDGNYETKTVACNEEPCLVDCGLPPAGCTAESTSVGGAAVCECDEGFTAIGNTTIVCQGDGTWSDREFNCSSVCIDSQGDPWIQLDPDISSSYYFFQGNDKTFDKAKERCENRGGMLVRIDSYEENQMLWDYIKNKGGNRWTALRVNHDTDIEYWTDSPGVQANFTNWADGEPNDHTGEESCVQLLKENGKWNDVECVKTIQVICEMIECGGWWSEWVLWSECDVTCGDGVEVYHRQCYGDICPGGDGNYETKTVACNEEPCLVDCGLPPAGCTAESTSVGGAAVCECDEGFTAIGNTTIVCQGDGTWSDREFNCSSVCIDSQGDPWIQLDPDISSSYYFFQGNDKTFDKAKERCENRGGMLVRIDSYEENQMLWDYIKNKGGNRWTALRVNHDTDIEYWTDSPGVQANFTNWADGEPNDHTGEESCVQLLKENGKWNDVECVKTIQVICEMIECGGWWSEWVLWSECDVTCGDGVEVYHRQCYGDICPGGDVNYETKSVACNEEPCPVDCGLPPAGCTAESTSVGGAAVCECDEGFTAIGNTTIVCLDDGTWSDREFNCSSVCIDSQGDPWIQLDPDISSSYYFFQGNDKTFDKAKERCEDRGGMLVRIDSYEENQMLWDYIKNKGGNRWTALRVNHDTGIEYWTDSPGVQANFTNWADGEPNDHTGEESCVQLLKENGKWNDVECVKTIQVICEMIECGGWWSEWVLWSECDVTCGDGVEVYHRQCYGDICPGGDGNYETKTVACNEEPCPVDCGLPPAGCTAESTSVGGAAVCECDEGFTAIGNTTIVCQDDGTWSDREFNCSSVCIDSKGDPWIQLDPDISSSYYFFQGNDKTFDKAEEKCEKRGGMLVRIDSYEENQMLWDYIKNKGGNRWTALRVDHSTGIEYWSDSPGVQANFTNWADGEPNDHTGEESCVQLLKENGKWNDVECVKTIQVICEMKECDGWWSEWVQWSECSQSCDEGFITYRRQCYGDACPGDGGNYETKTELCDEGDCPDSGSWTEWVLWGECSKTCGNGYVTYRRHCVGDCSDANWDDDEKTELCNEGNCQGDCNCPANTECVHSDDGSYICKCLSGFMGDCDECVDIDECGTETYDCPKHSECVNTIGSYYCECEEGFTFMKEKCLDVNECRDKIDNCPEYSVCVNTYGSFQCVCCDGYDDDGNGNCVDTGEDQTTGHECCVCRGKRCNDEGEVCGEDGITYDNWADMIVAQCEQDIDIGVDYNGSCQASCSDVKCPRYQECLEKNGRATCECEICTHIDDITGPVCSSAYQSYDNLCHFYHRMCEYNLEQDKFENNIPCDDPDKPVGEWSEWGDCEVTCGKGIKTRTREAKRQLFGEEIEKYRLTSTADCYKDPCPGGPCDGFDCENEAAECIVNENGEAECECPSCREEGVNTVCGLVGDRMQTVQNLCRLQRRACKENSTFELLYEGPCTENPLHCSKLAKFEKVANDKECVSQRRQLTHYCRGGCGDDPELCCEATAVRTLTFEVWCPWGEVENHQVLDAVECDCRESTGVP
ncbi:hypothetical protein ScPMuIL_013212 [Solemya velum]